MFDKVICFIAHCRFGVTDYLLTILLFGKTCKQVNLPVDQHLIKLAVTAIDIFIFPACVFRQLQIVFIRIAFFDRTFASTLLKDLVLVISNSDGLDIILSKNRNGQSKQRHHQYTNKCGQA